jgi:hypothetical protein
VFQLGFGLIEEKDAFCRQRRQGSPWDGEALFLEAQKPPEVQDCVHDSARIDIDDQIANRA